MTNPIPRKVVKKIKAFEYPITATKFLSKPRPDSEVKFFETILNRRSQRVFAPINEGNLSALLYYSAKTLNTNFSKEGYLWSNRPTPSAGGIHPIDIIVCTIGKLRSSISYYNPIDHSLNTLELDDKKVALFIKHTNEILPGGEQGVILWLLAHEYRTASKYRNHKSLVWRDAGCLLFCLNLVSSALKLNFCLLGSLGEPHISDMFKEYGQVYGVGGCIFGDPIT